MHPLLALLVTRPQLLLDHTLAYAALFSEESNQAYTRWQRKTLLQLVAVCCLGVGWVLAGVAWMLWALVPTPLLQLPWAVWAMPLLPLCLALLCLWGTRGLSTDDIFSRLKQQINADMALLHAVSPP